MMEEHADVIGLTVIICSELGLECLDLSVTLLHLSGVLLDLSVTLLDLSGVLLDLSVTLLDLSVALL